jgi:hypothetical protein
LPQEKKFQPWIELRIDFPNNVYTGDYTSFLGENTSFGNTCLRYEKKGGQVPAADILSESDIDWVRH